MSKNFELLHNISNEKDLFQTLDGWEDTDDASAGVGQEASSDGKARAKTQPQTSLPDVFRAINHTFGSFDLETPNLSRDAKPLQKPAKEPFEEEAHAETQNSILEGRFPISRNPITRLSSALDIPETWIKQEIRSEPNSEIELELEPETLPSTVAPESRPTPERAASSSAKVVQGTSPAEEGKAQHEPRPFRTFGVDEGKSNIGSSARKGQTRHSYKDKKREAIAHEEELKLVQRVFLAEEGSPQMVLFSGFERNSGCASICIHAAQILAAQAEGSVCLVDMGFRAPSLHEFCGVPNERGFAEALAGSIPIQEFAQQLSPANLWMIPGGYGAPQLNFGRVADHVRARMEALRQTFRFVVVHSGSLWPNADAMLISKWTDGVVLILEAHSTRRDIARRIKESLAVANARLLGVVLNNRTYPIPETLYSRL